MSNHQKPRQISLPTILGKDGKLTKTAHPFLILSRYTLPWNKHRHANQPARKAMIEGDALRRALLRRARRLSE